MSASLPPAALPAVRRVREFLPMPAAQRPPVQPVETLDAVYAGAADALVELNDKLAEFCLRHDVDVVLPPLKARERAERKVAKDYKNKPQYLCDVLRCTIVCRDLGEAQRALAAVAELGEPVRIKDRFTSPRPTGYRDANVNLRMSNGHIAEVQIHLQPMLEAKQREIFYYRLRDLDAAAADRRLTRRESEQRERLLLAARTLYDSASQRSTLVHGSTPRDGYLSDALRIANVETERLRVAAQNYLLQPAVRGLARDVRRAASLSGDSFETTVAELKPCGRHKPLLDRFVDRLSGDARATHAYVAFHNALLDCRRAWAQVASSFAVERVPEPVYTQSWRSVDGMLSELRHTGAAVPAMPGESLAGAAEQIARTAVDSLARPRFLHEVQPSAGPVHHRRSGRQPA